MTTRCVVLVGSLLLPLLAGCGDRPVADEGVCEQAVERYNSCVTQLGADGFELWRLHFSGPCSDQALGAEGRTIPLRTWSEDYLACEVDRATCRCPGQTWVMDL